MKTTNESLTPRDFFARTDVKAKFQEMLGKRASAFITSVLQVVASNDLLKEADVMTIYNSAAVAATLDLPLNNQLGFAYIIPFKTKIPGTSETRVVAQFMVGYKGFIQLAQRSGQFRTISARPIFEGQMIEDNSFDGFHFDWSKKKSDIIIGYAAYFKLLNGFEKTLYMSIYELKKHGKRYSQTFKFDKGLWKDDPEVMYMKTVIKLLLSKFALLSIEMQRAIITDQSVINDAENMDVTYIDNQVEEKEDAEVKRRHLLLEDKRKEIEQCTSLQQLKAIVNIPDELADIWQNKYFQIEQTVDNKKPDI